MKKNMIEHVFILKLYLQSSKKEFSEDEDPTIDEMYLDYTVEGIKRSLLEEFDNNQNMFSIDYVKSTYLNE